MPKILQLMQVTTLVPVTRAHELDAFLEQIGASSVMMRPYRNGEIAPAKKPKGPSPGHNIKGMSAQQQQWIGAAIKRQMTLDDIRAGWEATPFRREGLYGALATAVRKKLITKVRPGVYKPKAVKHG